MKNISSIINVIKIIVKYSAIVTAIIKGITVVCEELEKIDLKENPKANE